MVQVMQSLKNRTSGGIQIPTECIKLIPTNPAAVNRAVARGY